MSQCVPPIPIRPCVLKYLGKTHNLWFRSTLMLEHQAFEKGLSLQIKPKQTTEFYEQESITPPQQVRPPLICELCLPWQWLKVSVTVSQVILNPSTVRLLYWRKEKSLSWALRNHDLCFQEILDSLAELYSLLQEEDMWAGLWQKRCKYSETATAIAYEQHGFFEQVDTVEWNGWAAWLHYIIVPVSLSLFTFK